MLMQNSVGTDLLQDLHFLFIIVILGDLKGLVFRIEMLIRHATDGKLILSEAVKLLKLKSE